MAVNSLAETFAGRRRALLVPFVTAAFPQADSTAPMLAALEQSGADIVEIGVPFSDPTADGLAIQRSSQRAIENGGNLEKTLAQLKEARAAGCCVPVVLMGYSNNFLAFGLERLAKESEAAQVGGVIAVDLAAADYEDWSRGLNPRGVFLIPLLAPTTPAARIAMLAKKARAFLYYVSLKGVTGDARLDVKGVGEKMAEIRRHTPLPVAVGFGVRTPQQARAVGEVADAVVVGSRLIEAIEDAEKNGGDAAAAAGEVVREMAAAMAEKEE